MQIQPLTPLKPTPAKKARKQDDVLEELDQLQKLKKEQSKQMVSEIRVLTKKRNFLLKQIKELFTVVQDLKYKKEKLTKSIDKYAKRRMKEIKAVEGPDFKIKKNTKIDPGGIMR